MPRVLVVLPTSSYRTHDFVVAAERMGVDLAVASEQDPPLDLGERFVRIDCTDPDAAARRIVDLADRTPIDAVVAADDGGVVTAAIASEMLGLRHHPPAATAATRDKLEMRRLLASSEVPQPAYEPLEAPSAGTGLSFPVVVKPRTASASRGVLRVDRPQDLPAAFATVRRIADEIGESGPLLAETLVAGSEVALEGMVVDGRLTVLAVFDKPDNPTGPTFPETILVTPSGIGPAAAGELERVVSASVEALGLSHGPIHAEAIVDSRSRVYLLEVAARSIGGLCSRSLRFGLAGTSLEELILATALGQPDTVGRQPRPTGVMMLPVPESGKVAAVDGVEAARATQGVTEVDITVTVGEAVRTLPDDGRYLGFVFAVGDTPDMVVDRLRRAADQINFTIS